MRLKSTLARESKHKDFVSCVGWVNSDEVFSAGDDHQLLKWNLITGETHNLAGLPDSLFPTDMHWYPRGVGGGKRGAGSELFVLTSSDGKFYLISKTGRVEKSVDAHLGSVVMARWSYDGTSLITVGEDGMVKIWSRSGMLRSTLAQNSSPVYGACWSSDNSQVLYCCGKNLHLKPIQANSKAQVWKAHDEIVVKVDWNPSNNLIVSGGEDRKYKVWDSYGRLMYSSSEDVSFISAIAWSPNGDYFAVGSFNTLRLCDKAGWSYALEKPQTGSFMNLRWSPDGTQIAGACSNGHVIFSQVIENRVEWLDLEALQTKRKTVEVRNVSNESVEKLELRDRIVKMCMGWGYLVVATSAQCYIYNSKNWNTPIIIDLKEGSVTLITMAAKQFLLVDGTSVGVYGYDGRLQAPIKYPGMRTDLLNDKTVGLSSDTVVIRDKNDEKQLFMFETNAGKPVGDGKITHTQEVQEVTIDQNGPVNERRVAFVDKNNDCFLAAVKTYGSGERIVKLGAMIQTIKFNDNTNMLCGLQDSLLYVWCYPNAAYVDKELLPKTIYQREQGDFGKNPRLINFVGNHITVRRSDGSLVGAGISPFAAMLHLCVGANKWDDGLRMCRHIKDNVMWASLACMAAYGKNLNTAEIAYGAIEEVEKVQLLQQLRQTSNKDIRSSELWLLSGNVQESEGALLQSGLTFRAIYLNIELYRWDRALELAMKHKTHVDTVVAYRQQYLEEFGMKETKPKFIEMAKEIDYDIELIEEKVKQELEKGRK